jgi:hypothetical protein
VIAAPELHRRIDPTDPQFHLLINLRDIRNGVKSRAPGIRRCRDCTQPWIDDHSGLPCCTDCRVNHHRACQQCGTAFRNTEQGDRFCFSRTNQDSLF